MCAMCAIEQVEIVDLKVTKPQIGFPFKSVFHLSSIVNAYSMIIHWVMLSKNCLYDGRPWCESYMCES